MAYVFRYTLNGDYDAANSADILIYDGSTMASAISPDAAMTVGQAYNLGDLPNGAFYYNQSLNGGQNQVTNSFRDANNAMMFLGTAGLFLQWSSDNAARVTLTGSNFGDVLIGGAGSDKLYGNDGDDILEGGAGADTIKGGFGDDTVSYEHAYSGVILYMDGSGAGSGDAAGDVLTSIENARGSAFNDILFGDSLANRLEGGAGNDVLEGGGGADTLSGGAGNDVASYSRATTGVEVYLDGSGVNTGDAAGDLYSSIESIRGSGFADILVGDANANVIEGGAGADVIDGGAGADFASYRNSNAGVTVSLQTGQGLGGDAQGDTFVNIENLRGSLYDDVLTGDGSDNTLDGMGGRDQLFGLGGNDRLVVRNGAAMVDGGDGRDVAAIAAGSHVAFGDDNLVDVEIIQLMAGVTLDLSARTVATGRIGSSFDATILGTQADDVVILRAGDHVVTGGAGSDLIYAGAGSDSFVFDQGFGKDRLWGVDIQNDHLDLSALNLASDDLVFRAVNGGQDTRIEIAGNANDWILLRGVTVADMSAAPADFLIL